MSWVHSAVEGMRNFFGKKVGGFVSQAFADLSPIGLHTASESGKVATSVAPSFRQAVGAFRARFGEVMKSSPEPFRLSEYFRGFNAGEGRGMVSEAIRSRRQMTRLAMPATIGIGVLGDLAFGNDNGISGLARTAGSVALSTMAGYGLHGMYGAKASLPFAAIAGMNAIRRGDQWGFF